MKKLQILTIAILLLFLGSRPAFANELAKNSATLVLPQQLSVQDDRVAVLRGYLASNNSPLAPYSEDFVRSADKYRLDWRLVAAISGLESTFGQHIPYNSYNGWGWGIYGDNMIRFNSWPEGIETISRGLRENYLRDYSESDPYVIGPSYAASPTWAVRVSYFMQRIEDYRIRNAKDSLTISL